jgi:membrane protein DedA with SNARE-associated domain
VAQPDRLTGLAGAIADVMEALGEVGVAVLVALENLFPPIPSELVLPLAGFLASQGRMGLVLVIVAATVGSVVGALVLYEIGRRFGRRRMRELVRRVPLVHVTDLDKAEDWFSRHGQLAVFFGRFLPVVRSLISVPAGVEEMPRIRFAALTALGSAIWNTVFVVAGYVLGAQFTQVEQYSRWLNYAIYAAIAVLVLLGVRRAIRERAENR